MNKNKNRKNYFSFFQNITQAQLFGLDKKKPLYLEGRGGGLHCISAQSRPSLEYADPPPRKEPSAFFGPNCGEMFWRNEWKINFVILIFWVIFDIGYNFQVFLTDQNNFFFPKYYFAPCSESDIYIHGVFLCDCFWDMVDLYSKLGTSEKSGRDFYVDIQLSFLFKQFFTYRISDAGFN